jgi:hypothetical protein
MPVQQVAQAEVSVDEHVLLGCFGLNLAAVRQGSSCAEPCGAPVTPQHLPRSSSATARFSSAKPTTDTGSGDATNTRANSGIGPKERWIMWEYRRCLDEPLTSSTPTRRPAATATRPRVPRLGHLVRTHTLS